jgi:hypothetical protein
MSLLLIVALAAGVGSQAPKPPSGLIDVHAYCRMHPDDDGPGEVDPAELPAEVVKARATYWRCDAGKVMVCDGGATGAACLKTEAAVGSRLADLQAYCRRNPDARNMPDVTTMGLAQAWACRGTKPVATMTFETDAKSYFVDDWWPLP